MPRGVYKRTKSSWNRGLTSETDFRVAKCAIARKGKKNPKVSIARKKYFEDPANHVKLSIATKKRYEDPAERTKTSVAGKKRFEDPVEREKLRIANTDNPKMMGENSPNKRPEVRQKLRIALKKYFEDPANRVKTSVALTDNFNVITARKKSWQDPAYVSKQMVARHVRPNKAEKLLEKILDALYPGEFKYVGDGKDKQYIIAGKCPDFININGRKQIIELFGEPFHQPEEEQQRIDLFYHHNYQTLVIWYCELQNIDVLNKRILEFIMGDLKE